MENKKAIVVGAGVSGLCAATELKKLGFDVTVLEKENRSGGVISTFCENGFAAESGSNSVMVGSEKTLDFLKSAGLENLIAFSKPIAKNRFFVRYGKPRAVPMGPLSLIFTRLFTFFGKIRLLAEPFVKNEYSKDDDPSVAEFVEKRLGRDVLDYAINPFMAGVYAGNPKRLSVKHAFPPFWNFAQKYGSIIGGAIKSMKAKKREGNIFKPMMISFKGGMGTLPKTLSESLGESVKTNVKIFSIDYDDGSWNVSWSNEEEEVIETYDAIVIAVPAPELKGLPFCGPVSEKLEILDKIEYAPVATYTMGFEKKDIKNSLNGFGTLIPEKENFSILGALYVSSIFEGKAPSGGATITTYIGGMRNPKLASLPQSELKSVVLKDLGSLLGVRGEPKFEKLYVWKHAIAQYNVGYENFLEAMSEVESEFENFKLIGAYRGGVGVSSCIDNACAAAKAIADKLAQHANNGL